MSAYLVAPGDVEGFRDKIREVFADSERAERIGKAGREVALRKFDYGVHAKALREWIQSI